MGASGDAQINLKIKIILINDMYQLFLCLEVLYLRKQIFNVMYKSLIIFVVLGFGLTSCSDALDVNRDFSFSHEVDIIGDESTYFSSDLVDLKEEVDVIDEYGDNIKEIDIQRIDVSIVRHNGPADQNITQARIEIADADGTGPVEISSLEQVDISALINSPQTLELNEDGLSKLNRLIKNSPHDLRLVLVGEINEAPADFTLKFDFEGKMVANPL